MAVEHNVIGEYLDIASRAPSEKLASYIGSAMVYKGEYTTEQYDAMVDVLGSLMDGSLIEPSKFGQPEKAAIAALLMRTADTLDVSVSGEIQ